MAKSSFKSNNRPTLESIHISLPHLLTPVSCLDFIRTLVKDTFAFEFTLLYWAAPRRPPVSVLGTASRPKKELGVTDRDITGSMDGGTCLSETRS